MGMLRDAVLAAVAVPCVYDINFIVKAWEEQTRVILDGNVGVIESLYRQSGSGPSGKITITILSQGVRSACTVVAR